MPYSCQMYNPPEVGNANIYAYGTYHCFPIEFCGFIYADTRPQAEAVLQLHNDKWGDYDNVLQPYGTDVCRDEIERRARNNSRSRAKIFRDILND